MNTRITALTALAIAWILAASAAAEPLSAQLAIEGRVGSSLPNGELTDAPGLNQTAGLSFAADAIVSVSNRFSLYAGASRQSFNCESCPTDVATWGFDGGLKYLFPSSGAAMPWARGGLMLHRASIDGSDLDWGVGVDAGVGLDWLVRPSLAIVPALRLNSYSSGPLSLSYVTIDLGLHVHL